MILFKFQKHVHILYTYSFFLARDGFLLGLSPSESLLPCKCSQHNRQLNTGFVSETQEQFHIAATRWHMWAAFKQLMSTVCMCCLSSLFHCSARSFHFSLLTPAPMFKRAGSCLLRFDLLTPYTSGCSSHICIQGEANHQTSMYSGLQHMSLTHTSSILICKYVLQSCNDCINHRLIDIYFSQLYLETFA